jgi:hypothetical protein
MRKGFAWFVQGVLYLVSLYLVLGGGVCAFAVFECTNNLIDEGLDEKYASLNLITVAAGLAGSAVLFKLAFYLRKRRGLIHRYVAGASLLDRGEGPPQMKATGPASAGRSIRRMMIVVLVLGLASGGLVLNRRSRSFYRLAWEHHWKSSDGHDGRSRPSPRHAAYHATLARKYERLGAFPLWAVAPDPPEPE